MPAPRLQLSADFVRTFSQLSTQCVAAVSVMLLICFNASAQTTGSMVGKATDPRGAVVPGVTIKATNQATSFSREAATSVSGEYVISLLPVGGYIITAQKQGFEPYTLPHVIFAVNGIIR